MGLVAEKQEFEKKQYDLPKKGPRPATLTGLIDVGVHIREYKGEKKPPQREFVPIFTLMSDEYKTEEGETLKHRVRLFPMKMLAGATRGHYFDFTQALDPNGLLLPDCSGDITQLLGKSCFCSIVYSEPSKDGIVYANCKTLSELPEDYPIKDFEGDFLVFDTNSPDRSVFEGLTDFLKDQIRTSEGYTGSDLELTCEGESPPKPNEQPDEVDPFDDDIPF